MSMKSDLNALWEEWKRGVTALVYAGTGVVLSYIVASILLIVFHAIFGGHANFETAFNFSIPFAIIFVPVALSRGFDAIVEYEQEHGR